MKKPHRPAPQSAPASQSTQIDDATLRSFIGYHIKRTSNVVLADLARTLRPFDLRMSTYTALILIVDNPGLRQSQLADAMDIERPNLVVIIDELERRELINRDRVPTDRRAYALNTTLAGRHLYEKAVEAVTEHERHLLAELNDERRAQLMAALKVIETSLTRG